MGARFRGEPARGDGARLLVLEGVIQRSEEGVIHLMTVKAYDRGAELDRLSIDYNAETPLLPVGEVIRQTDREVRLRRPSARRPRARRRRRFPPRRAGAGSTATERSRPALAPISRCCAARS